MDFSPFTQIVLAILQNSRGWNAAALALAAFGLYVLAANIAWRIARAPDSATAKSLRAFAAQRGVRALYEIVRLIFYLGVPFAALYFGWIDMRSMGLGAWDWAEGSRWAIVILLAAWLLLMLIWFPYLRATMDVYATPATQPSFARRMVELVYMQAHWAFYRAVAVVMMTGILPDALYWGGVVGLAFVLMEAILNPRVRAQLTQIGQADPIIWAMGQAFINALAFLVTRNLLLLVLIHFLLELTVPHLRAIRDTSRATAPAPPRVQRVIRE